MIAYYITMRMKLMNINAANIKFKNKYFQIFIPILFK